MLSDQVCGTSGVVQLLAAQIDEAHLGAMTFPNWIMLSLFPITILMLSIPRPEHRPLNRPPEPKFQRVGTRIHWNRPYLEPEYSDAGSSVTRMATVVSLANGVAMPATVYDRWKDGLICMEKGRFLRAIYLFTQCLEEDELSVEVQNALLLNRGVCHILVPTFAEDFEHDLGHDGIDIALHERDTELEFAVRDFNQVLRLDSDNALALAAQGYAFYEKGQIDLAIELYDQALQLEPDDPAVLNNRGNAYADWHGEAEAIQEYDKAISSKPDYAAALHNRGTVYRSTKEFDKAILNLDTAICIDAELAETYQERGLIYKELGESEKALHDFKKAYDLRGSSFFHTTSEREEEIAWELRKLGKLSRAEIYDSFGLHGLFESLPVVCQFGLRAIFNVHIILVGLLTLTSAKLVEHFFPNAFMTALIRLQGVLDSVLEFTVISTLVAVVCFVVSVALGVFRQTSIALVAGTFPMLTEDDDGQTKTVYLGISPPEIWFSWPFRVGTWLLVAILSIVFSAVSITIATTLDPQSSILTWVFAALIVAYLRWLISALIAWNIARAIHRAT